MRRNNTIVAASVIVVLAVLWTGLASAYSEPEEDWNKTFGTVFTDTGYSVRQTSDGGYIIAGASGTFKGSQGGDDAYLIKTYPDGTEEWSRIYGGSGLDHARSVQQTSDGGYIIAGYTYSQGAGQSDVYLIKTYPNGTEKWSRTFGGSSYDEGYSVQQTSDRGYIITGRSLTYGGLYLIKTHPDGIEEWSKTYINNDIYIGYDVKQTLDGGYIIAGGSPFTDNPMYVLKTDSSGNEEWHKFLGGGSDDAKSVLQIGEDSFIIAGYTSSSGAGGADMYLAKLKLDWTPVFSLWKANDGIHVNSPNVYVEWERTYGGTEYEGAYDVQQTSDGGYILVGYTRSFGAGKTDAFVVKTDSDGIEMWSKAIGGTDWDDAYSVKQTSDEGYIITGDTESFGYGKDCDSLYDSDVWLIKLGAGGDLTPPSPEIIDVSHPSAYPSTCINEGKEVTISVTVRNNGDPSSEGYISVSFPNDEVVSSVSGTGNGYNDLIPIGSDISCATGTMTSVDPLVELQDFDWGAGEAHTLTMQVTPKSGYPWICFYVRAALKNDAEGTYERTPLSGPLDQQGWHIDLHSISAEYPGCAVLSPRSEYTGDDTYVWVITSYSSPDPEEIRVQILYDGDNLIFDSREKTIRLEPDQWGVVEFRVETLHSTKTDQFDVFIPELCLREPVSLNVTSHTVGDYLQAKLGSRVANVFLRSYPDEEIVNFAEGVLADYSLSRSSAEELKAMALLHYVYNHSEFREREGFIANPHDLIREINDNGYFYGVCRDYTSLYNALATAVGLEVRPVTGIFENGIGHAWSEVMIDGEWVLVDSTSGLYKDSILCACKWNGDSCMPNSAMKLWGYDERAVEGLPNFVTFSSGGFWPSDDHKKVYEHYPPKGGILFAATMVIDPVNGVAMHTEVTSDYSYNSLPPANALVVGGFSPVEISIYDSNGELIAGSEDYYMSWEDLDGNVVQDEEPIGKIAVALDIDSSEDYTVEITGTGEGVADIKALVETIDYTINIDYDNISVSSDFEATFSPTVGDYNLKIDYDGDGTIDEAKEPDSIKIIGETTYSIPLHTGWNLVSIPLVPEDSNIDSVFSSIAGNYGVVWTTTSTGGWKSSNQAFGRLTDITVDKGYLIYMTAPDTLVIEGIEPASTTIDLASGWNLVGYPSQTTRSITDVLSGVGYGVVWTTTSTGGWKSSDQAFGRLTDMSPGNGYMIYAPVSGSYTVD